MTILAQQELASGDDAICTQTGASYSATGTFMQINRHTSTANASSAGFRFQLPSGLDPDTIQTARLVLTPVNSGTTTSIPGYQVLAERTPAAAWANDATDRPNARYTTAVSNGSTPQTWDINGWSAGIKDWLPDVSTDIKAAMNHGSYTPGTSYVGIIVNGPIGSPAGAQWGTYDNSTASNRPFLRVTYISNDETGAITEMNVPYTDGIGPPNYRACDIYTPSGAAPADGWPAIIWMHSGYWKATWGDRTVIPAGFITYVTGTLNRVLINASYKLVNQSIVGSNTGPSFPEPIHDMRTLNNFIAEFADDWRINPERLTITGHSAGGHVAISTAVMGDNTSSYNGYDYASARTDAYGATRPAFILDKDITLANPWKGAFAWASPINVWNFGQHPDEAQAIAANIGRTGYMGGIQGTDPTINSDELDIDKYISGTSTVYGATTHEPNLPIGYTEATDDVIILPDAGIDPLYTSLGTSGFTYERPAVGTITATGLTRFEHAQGHEGVMESTDVWDDFGEWLEAVDPDPVTAQYRRNAAIVIS